MCDAQLGPNHPRLVRGFPEHIRDLAAAVGIQSFWTKIVFASTIKHKKAAALFPPSIAAFFPTQVARNSFYIPHIVFRRIRSHATDLEITRNPHICPRFDRV